MTIAIQVAIDEQNPWPGLGSFDEGAERFFNGRQNESAELRRLVSNAPLTVLFGASGLGKTSLVQAGLFPLARREHYLPVYVRLDLRVRDAPLIDQLKFALQTQLEARRVDAPAAMRGDESLWSYLHRSGLELWSEQNQLLTPLFVFDQFEEVFTLGLENQEAIARLRIDLADLIENRLPTALANRAENNEGTDASLSLDSQRYKVLLSFREDFLPAVEGWKRELPSILRNRLRLLPMSAESAFEAVHKTAPSLVGEDVALQIVHFVAAAQQDGAGRLAPDSMSGLAVEPALLSLVCHGLNEKRKAQNKPTFDQALLSGTGQSIISDYYRKAVGDLPERVQRFIENELITERGFRKPCDIDDARSVHGVTDQELRLLVDRRLLRIEPQRATERVELTHDLLTRVVREHRDRQREATRVKRQRRKMLGLAVLGATLLCLVVLFGWLYYGAKKQRQLALDATSAAQEALAGEKGAVAAQKVALDDRDQALGKAEAQRKNAEMQRKIAEAARRDAELQARIATAGRLATLARLHFAPSAEGLAVSGALAVESLRSSTTSDGMEALARVLRLTPSAPQVFAKVHERPVRALAYSPDGRFMASGGEDGSVILWDVPKHMNKTVLEKNFASGPSAIGIAFSHDGHWLAVGGMRAVRIWDTEALTRTEIPTQLNFIRSLAFSPDGSHLAAVGQGGAALLERTGGHWQEQGEVSQAQDLKPEAVILPTNDNLVFAGSSGVFPSKYGVWLTNLKFESSRALSSSNDNECRAVAVSQDASVLAALCYKGILVASSSNGDFTPSQDVPPGGGGPYSASRGIALNRDGSYVAALDNTGDIHVFGHPITEESSLMSAEAASVTFRPDANVLAAGSTDGSIILWPTTHGTNSIRLPWEGTATPTGLAFTPDEALLATTDTGGYLQIFNISNVHRIQRLQRFQIGKDLQDVIVCQDGRYLAVRNESGVHLIQIKPWNRLASHDLPGKFRSAAFSPDNKLLIASGADEILLSSTSTGDEQRPVVLRFFDKVYFTGEIRLSPDGQWLATLSKFPGRNSNYLTQVWNAKTGGEAAWSGDLRRATNGASVRAQQGGSQDLIADSANWMTADSHTWSSNSKDPRRFQGGWGVSLEGSTARLSKDDRDIASLEHDGKITDAAFSPRGRWLATSGEDGTVRLWPLQASDMIDQACKLLPRNLTPDEWKGLKMDGPYRKTCPDLPYPLTRRVPRSRPREVLRKYSGYSRQTLTSSRKTPS